MTDEFSTLSHIWDVNERNLPLLSLKSPSPLICCQYNGKQSDLLLGGCYNGMLNLYDVRKGPTPVKRSVVETYVLVVFLSPIHLLPGCRVGMVLLVDF